MNTINFVSIEVKCPICGKSLMDSDHKVDNEPGIKMNAESNGKKGFLVLSSIYGSFNYISNIEFDKGEIVRFYCPHCSGNLMIDEICLSCDAPMVSLILEMGGKVSFCSRKGCQSHSIGFNDLSVALKRFYEEFGYTSKHHKAPEHIHLKKDKEVVKTHEEEKQEIIESGSFLMAYCPHCRKSLIENEMFKLKIVREGQEPGYILLSPYLNVFSSKSTIFLPEDQKVGEIRCFHCDKPLIVDNGKCERCGTEIARILVSARTKMIDFFICSKKGCTWHGLNKNDLENIRLEDSMEW